MLKSSIPLKPSIWAAVGCGLRTCFRKVKRLENPYYSVPYLMQTSQLVLAIELKRRVWGRYAESSGVQRLEHDAQPRDN